MHLYLEGLSMLSNSPINGNEKGSLTESQLFAIFLLEVVNNFKKSARSKIKEALSKRKFYFWQQKAETTLQNTFRFCDVQDFFNEIIEGCANKIKRNLGGGWCCDFIDRNTFIDDGEEGKTKVLFSVRFIGYKFSEIAKTSFIRESASGGLGFTEEDFESISSLLSSELSRLLVVSNKRGKDNVFSPCEDSSSCKIFYKNLKITLKDDGERTLSMELCKDLKRMQCVSFECNLTDLFCFYALYELRCAVANKTRNRFELQLGHKLVDASPNLHIELAQARNVGRSGCASSHTSPDSLTFMQSLNVERSSHPNFRINEIEAAPVVAISGRGY